MLQDCKAIVQYCSCKLLLLSWPWTALFLVSIIPHNPSYADHLFKSGFVLLRQHTVIISVYKFVAKLSVSLYYSVINILATLYKQLHLIVLCRGGGEVVIVVSNQRITFPANATGKNRYQTNIPHLMKKFIHCKKKSLKFVLHNIVMWIITSQSVST